MGQNYSKEELLYMYEHLKRGRMFTLKMHDCVQRGLIRTSFHTPWGEEAIGVGIAAACKPTDFMGFTHRTQPGLIMRYNLYEFICELFGKFDGPRKGSAFDFHLGDLRLTDDSLRIMPTLGTLGGAAPMACGIAEALKMTGRPNLEVCVTPYGDSACSEGAVYEAWNEAALYKLPIVFVIVNNGWGMSVPLVRESFNPNISEKAVACGLPIQIADGNDILAVREAMDIAIEKARNCEPNVVELKTLRWGPHFLGQNTEYLTEADFAKVKEAQEKDDCVKRYEAYLIDQGIIDQAYIDEMTAKIQAELDDAVERADKCRIGTFEEVYAKNFIYANPETGGEL